MAQAQIDPELRGHLPLVRDVEGLNAGFHRGVVKQRPVAKDAVLRHPADHCAARIKGDNIQSPRLFAKLEIGGRHEAIIVVAEVRHIDANGDVMDLAAHI